MIEIITKTDYLEVVKEITTHEGIDDFWWETTGEKRRLVVRVLIKPNKRQQVFDACQRLLLFDAKARIIVIPVEVVLTTATKDAQKNTNSQSTTREELYQEIEKGARLDSLFILLVILSTIVAAIGLIEDNTATLIGAMVIAPLLGPNIALAFATALGDVKLFWQALKSNVVGIGIAVFIGAVIGLLLPLDFQSQALLARTDVGLSGIVIALASGSAAVLSLSTGLSSVLVGVMVAVALLPPAATIGIMLGEGQWHLAGGAGLLLAVNVVCVNLSAKIVFLVKGIKPRIWLAKYKAQQSSLVYISAWLVSLTLLIVIIYIRH
jgi:uncharacterized hydrophobic protein (TIGR00341 family)